MASGLVCRANRPNTWLHRPACERAEKPCQLGAVHTWHKRQFVALASIRSLLEVKRTCRDRGRRIDPTRLTLSRHTPN